MSEQIMVFADKKTRGALIGANRLADRNLEPLWCEYDVSLLTLHKEKTNVVLFFLPEEITTEVERLLYYLRDICIDEEKVVYMYGSLTNLAFARAIIPGIFIGERYDEKEYGIADIVDRVAGDLNSEGREARTILMVDEDTAHFKEMAIPLRNHFHVIVIEPVLEDVTEHLKKADILIIGVHARFSVIDNSILFALIAKKQEQGRLKLIFAADDKEEQNRVNVIRAKSALCFAKTMAIDKVVNYLVSYYS